MPDATAAKCEVELRTEKQTIANLPTRLDKIGSIVHLGVDIALEHGEVWMPCT